MSMIILGVLFTVLLFLFGVLGMMYTNLRDNDKNLQMLNHKLNEDINELTTKNAILNSEVIQRTEERAVAVGSTVTWLDKQKEIVEYCEYNDNLIKQAEKEIIKLKELKKNYISNIFNL